MWNVGIAQVEDPTTTLLDVPVLRGENYRYDGADCREWAVVEFSGKSESVLFCIEMFCRGGSGNVQERVLSGLVETDGDVWDSECW